MLHDSEALKKAIGLLKNTGVWQQGGVYDLITVEGHRTISPNPHHHTIIIIKPNSEATLTAQATGAISIIVEENAKLRYLSASKEQVKSFIYLSNDAQLIWNDASLTSSAAESTVYLAGQGANARYGSVMLGNNTDCAQQITMIHAASHTSSYMLTRAVLTGTGKGRYRGTIRIASNAKGCDAHQKADTLLLGEQSRIDAVPVLEINNEDVKCSHGVSIGQIDEEQLYYLQSRGIDRQLATHMIITGFFDQMLIAMGEPGERMRKELEAVI